MPSEMTEDLPGISEISTEYARSAVAVARRAHRDAPLSALLGPRGASVAAGLLRGGRGCVELVLGLGLEVARVVALA